MYYYMIICLYVDVLQPGYYHVRLSVIVMVNDKMWIKQFSICSAKCVPKAGNS